MTLKNPDTEGSAGFSKYVSDKINLLNRGGSTLTESFTTSFTETKCLLESEKKKFSEEKRNSKIKHRSKCVKRKSKIKHQIS